MWLQSRLNPRQAMTIRYWMMLGVLLVILLMIKELVVQVDMFAVDLAAEVSSQEVSYSPYRIHINLDEQTMYVYKDEELYKTYPVSGGKNKTPSPLGEWRIIHKAKWGDGFGGHWMGLNVPWGKYGIHGTRQPWFIGRENVSGGCIRMNNKDAEQLYDFIPHGTKVSIIYDSLPFRNFKDGDFGSDVYRAQKALKALGYFHDWCNGKFGLSTKKAVLSFQKKYKLRETGIVNISTWDALMERYEEVRDLE